MIRGLKRIYDWLKNTKEDEVENSVLEQMVEECHDDGKFRRQLKGKDYCMLLGDQNLVPCSYRAEEDEQVIGSTYLYRCYRKG